MKSIIHFWHIQVLEEVFERDFFTFFCPLCSLWRGYSTLGWADQVGFPKYSSYGPIFSSTWQTTSLHWNTALRSVVQYCIPFEFHMFNLCYSKTLFNPTRFRALFCHFDKLHPYIRWPQYTLQSSTQNLKFFEPFPFWISHVKFTCDTEDCF